MRNIRVMTFNIQAQAWPAGPSSEAEQRAEAVVKALNSSKPLDMPDVVVFNEADNEDAKTILVNGLKANYPHFIESFGGFPATPDDSGLAIFSKFPFVRLPDSDANVADNLARFIRYGGISVSPDSLMDKGVGIVQLSTGMQFEIITLAFTHLQAFYKYVGQYSNIRRKQLRIIEDALIELLGPPDDNFNWFKLIIMGDLNIRGDLHPNLASEWKNTFVTVPSIYSTLLVDSWRTFMKSPSAIRELDKGLTNYNLAPEPRLPAGLEERLDYICMPNPLMGANSDFNPMIPHYMRILPFGHTDLDQLYREVNSDHKAILADIHWSHPNCTPSTAFTKANFSVHTDPNSLVSISIINLNFRWEGVYQWIYLNEPGTYTFFGDRDMEIDYYFEDNVSTSIDPYDRVRASDLGFNHDFVDIMVHEFRMSDKGSQVDVYKPIFIRIRGGEINPNFRGISNFAFLKHTGETWQTAIKLRAWDKPKSPNLPFNQKNGASDDCWFLATIDGQLWSGEDHNSKFYIQNRKKRDIKIEVYDNVPPTRLVGIQAGIQTKLEQTYQTNSPKRIYMLLRRANLTDTEFLAGWQSEISYLSHSLLRLYCIKETFELSASDEIRVQLFADDQTVPFLNVLHEDFDKGELKTLNNHLPSQQIGFKKHVRVKLIEEDDTSADDVAAEVLLLAQTVSDPMVQLSLSKEISIDEGKYRVEYGLSRNEI